jgi:hypothetical protein
MKTVDAVETLWAAEKAAQAIVDLAEQDAQRIRSETEAQVAGLTKKTDDEITATREREELACRREAKALRAGSRERIAAARKEIACRLKAGKADAVSAVVRELTTT